MAEHRKYVFDTNKRKVLEGVRLATRQNTIVFGRSRKKEG
jgi:hypothetical protein